MEQVLTISSDEDSCDSTLDSSFRDLPPIHLSHSPCKRNEEEKYLYNESEPSNNTSDISPLATNIDKVVVNDGTRKRNRKKAKPVNEENNKSPTHKTRNAVKALLVKERASKKTAAMLNKIYRPGECMKYMNVEMHPTLADLWYMADVSRELSSYGVKIIRTSSLINPALVMWSRTVPPTLMNTDGQVHLSPTQQSIKRALYISTIEDLVPYIKDHTLAKHMMEVQKLTQCSITLVIFGVKEYFKSMNRRTDKNNDRKITYINLEMAVTDLLVTANCDAILVNKPNDLALHLMQFTKAIAEEPYKKSKRACEEQAEFYMKGDNKKCVAIDNDGNGVARLWQQMIAILPSSSLETSRAICGQYESPSALYEALVSPNSVSKLADIGVSRAAVPGSKARRIGPEFARKLHLLMTADDGNMLLD